MVAELSAALAALLAYREHARRDLFTQRGATAADAARTATELGLPADRLTRSLIRHGIIREVDGRRFYLDEAQARRSDAAAMRVLGLVIVGLVVLGVLIALGPWSGRG